MIWDRNAINAGTVRYRNGDRIGSIVVMVLAVAGAAALFVSIVAENMR